MKDFSQENQTICLLCTPMRVVDDKKWNLANNSVDLVNYSSSLTLKPYVSFTCHAKCQREKFSFHKTHKIKEIDSTMNA